MCSFSFGKKFPDRAATMQLEKCSRLAALQLLDDFSFYKKMLISSSVLKDVSPSPSPRPARKEIGIYESWRDYKCIDSTVRKVLALTLPPLPASTCWQEENSHWKQPGIEIHARFAEWAAGTLHCSTANSTAPSQLRSHWPVTILRCRQWIVCSALGKEIGRDYRVYSLDGLWEDWQPSRRDILPYRYLSAFLEPGKYTWTPKSHFGMSTMMWFSKVPWHI